MGQPRGSDVCSEKAQPVGEAAVRRGQRDAQDAQEPAGRGGGTRSAALVQP